MTNEGPLLARFLESLLDGRDEVAGNVVADGAVFELETFLHFFGILGERLKTTNDLRTATCDERCRRLENKSTPTLPYCP
jgi:hypothetical protein